MHKEIYRQILRCDAEKLHRYGKPIHQRGLMFKRSAIFYPFYKGQYHENLGKLLQQYNLTHLSGEIFIFYSVLYSKWRDAKIRYINNFNSFVYAKEKRQEGQRTEQSIYKAIEPLKNKSLEPTRERDKDLPGLEYEFYPIHIEGITINVEGKRHKIKNPEICNRLNETLIHILKDYQRYNFDTPSTDKEIINTYINTYILPFFDYLKNHKKRNFSTFKFIAELLLIIDPGYLTVFNMNKTSEFESYLKNYKKKSK